MNIVLFTPSDKALLYEVKIDTYNKDAKKKSRELAYKTEVKKLRETFDYIVNFKRFDLDLDKTKFHNSIDEIIIIFGKLFEDINLKISPYGEIKKIENFIEIQEKWEAEIKYRVSKTYKGILVESMIANIDMKMGNETLFIQSLYRDPFFFSYILSINGEYQSNKRYCTRTLDSFNGVKDIEVNYKFELDGDKQTKKAICGCGFLTDKEKKRLIEVNHFNNIDYQYNSNYEFDNLKYIKSISVSQSIIIDHELSMRQRVLTRLI